MAKNLSPATFAHNTFKSPLLANYSPYELVFCTKPHLLNLETMFDIKVSGTIKRILKYVK